MRALYGALFALAIAGLSPAAHAQSSPNTQAQAQVPAANPASAAQRSGPLLEGEGVLDRARPEYDAIGLPFGGLQLYPSVAVGVSADDNIYRAPSQTSDFLWTVSPRLDLRSDWTRNAFQLYGQLDHYAYQEHDNESRTNWIVGGAGRYDIQQGSFLRGEGSYFDTHESRTSPDLSNLALSPTHYTRGHSNLMLVDTLSAVTLSANFIYDRYDYDPTRLIGGGQINNSDRDRNVYAITGNASYEVSANHNIFAQFTYDRRDFDLLIDRNGYNRSSHGFRADVGTEMAFTPLIRGTVSVGWLQQDYTAPLHDAQGIDFNAKIDWFVTELVTAHLTASRTLADTTINGASSMDVRQVGASVDYELLRNVLLQAYTDYTDDRFDGIARDDQIVQAGIEAKYLLNRHLSLYAGYTFQQRDTNAMGRNFTDDLFSIGIRSEY